MFGLAVNERLMRMTLPLQQKAQAQYQQRHELSSLESYFQPEEARSDPRCCSPEVWYQSPALPHPRLLSRTRRVVKTQLRR